MLFSSVQRVQDGLGIIPAGEATSAEGENHVSGRAFGKLRTILLAPEAFNTDDQRPGAESQTP